MKKILAAITVSIIAFGASSLLAQDFPQWRGANREGKVTGFEAPSKWPTNLTQKWQTPIGKGDSSLALAGGKLYAFGRIETDEVLSCMDPATGKILWQSKYPADYVVTGPPARHPGPRATPTVAEGKVITLGVGGILACFDAAKGTELWIKKSTNDYLGVSYKNEISLSPLIDGGRCYAQIGGKSNSAFFAFDLASGAVKWKTECEDPADGSPVIATIAGKRQIVTLASKNLMGLSVEDGKILWKVPFVADMGNHTSPIIDGNTVYYIGAGKGLFAVKIEEKDGKLEATQTWSNPQLGARFSTPVLKDGRLYGYASALFCASAKTGEKIWTESGSSRGQSVAVLNAGSVLMALGVNGELVVYKPGDEFAPVAKYKVATTEAWAHPLVTSKGIYVRDAETVSFWGLE